jgi:hypothetical protein
MTLEQLRAAYEAKPFQHFVIHLADGREIPVPSREFIQAWPNGRTFAVYHNDAAHIIDLLLVTDLEFRPAVPRRRRSAQGE